MNKELFITLLDEIFEENLPLTLTDEQKEQMFVLSETLVETNKVMNLTAITDEKGIILRHIVDSLLISPHIPCHSTIIDVGCGAGFPTLPLAILRPDLKITALDATEKKIRFVSETAKLLGLENVTAMSGRAEELALTPEWRESFDFATARAVASLPVLCELTLPFVKVGGQLVAMKAKEAMSELESSKHAISVLCGANANDEVKTVSLALHAESSEPRTIIKIKKTAKTPRIYPRRYAQIKKSPL